MGYSVNKWEEEIDTFAKENHVSCLQCFNLSHHTSRKSSHFTTFAKILTYCHQELVALGYLELIMKSEEY